MDIATTWVTEDEIIKKAMKRIMFGTKAIFKPRKKINKLA